MLFWGLGIGLSCQRMSVLAQGKVQGTHTCARHDNICQDRG